MCGVTNNPCMNAEKTNPDTAQSDPSADAETQPVICPHCQASQGQTRNCPTYLTVWLAYWFLVASLVASLVCHAGWHWWR